ncbi:unnamed protein product, partial [Prorocentrum cordatum]
ANVPPWAVRHAAAQPVVDEQGWVRTGKGKKGRRKARAAAAAAAALGNGSDAGFAEGRDIEYLEGFPSVGGGHAGLVEEQLAALRAQRDELAASLAADKKTGFSRAAKLRREANSASK